jgi:hypothetical protein
MASKMFDMGWIERSVHLRLEFTGFKMAFLLMGREHQIIHEGFGEHSVFEKYIDLWIHSAI